MESAIRRILPAVLAVSLLTAMAVGYSAGPGVAPAEAQQRGLDEAEEMAVEALDRLMKALRLVIDTIPQYEAPEVLPNGDILIRRIHPDKKGTPDEEGEEPEMDETST